MTVIQYHVNFNVNANDNLTINVMLMHTLLILENTIFM